MTRTLIIILVALIMVGCKNSNTVNKIIENSSNEKVELQGDLEKIISLKKGQSLSDFIPEKWELISIDTGYLSPYKNPVIIAAYNTPILSKESGYSLRCFTVFEKMDNEIILRNQFLNMLDSCKDDSKNEYYEIKIRENRINISYRQFPRYGGTYSFEFYNEKQDWRLIYEEYSTCGTYPIYFMAFDFKTNEMNFEIRSDEKDIDTLIKVNNSVPEMLMSKFKNYKKFENKVVVKRYGEVNF